jgi:hypothetical protein
VETAWYLSSSTFKVHYNKVTKRDFFVKENILKTCYKGKRERVLVKIHLTPTLSKRRGSCTPQREILVTRNSPQDDETTFGVSQFEIAEAETRQTCN